MTEQHNSLAGFYFLLSTLMYPVSLGVAIIGISTAFSGFFRPDENMFFYIVSLFSPVLFILNLFFCVYWIIRKKRFSSPLFLSLCAVCIGFVPLVSFGKITSCQTNESIKIMSYNIGGFSIAPIEKEHDLRMLGEHIREHNPAVIAFQEFVSPSDTLSLSLSKILTEYPYRKSALATMVNQDKVGTMVFSKYPLLKPEMMDFGTGHNNAFICQLLYHSDTITLINLHMQTTGFNQTRNYLGVPGIASDQETYRAYSHLKYVLRENARIRSGQADKIRRKIEESPYPVVICGDLNDTPFSYTYRTLSQGLTDGFKDAGIGFGYTYRNLYNLFRIDYFLYSTHIKGISYQSPTLPYSDHNPILLEFSINR